MIGGGEGGAGADSCRQGRGWWGDDERGGRGINGEEGGGGVQTGIVYQHGYKMGVGG